MRKIEGGGILVENDAAHSSIIYADMVELADTLDLGSSARACGFESHYPHFSKKN